MIPRYALCNGGRRDGKRYPLHREIRPGYEFTWDGSTYRVIRQVIETNDGLPFIGRAPGMHPALLFALCSGGNGITYSIHAGEMIRAAIEGRAHELDAVFGFFRTSAGATA